MKYSILIFAALALTACNDRQMSYGSQQALDQIAQSTSSSGLYDIPEENKRYNRELIERMQRERELNDAYDEGYRDGRGGRWPLTNVSKSTAKSKFVRNVARAYDIPQSAARKIVHVLVGVSVGQFEDLRALGLTRVTVQRLWNSGRLSSAELQKLSRRLGISPARTARLMDRLASR